MKTYKTELSIRYDMLNHLCITTHTIQTHYMNSDYEFFPFKFNTNSCVIFDYFSNKGPRRVMLSNRGYLKV